MMNLNSKHSTHAGFTLIETILAIALVALSFGYIIDLQTSTARRVIDSVQQLDRMFTAYDFLISYMNGDDDEVTKTVTDPEVKLHFERKRAPEASLLAKEFNDLFVEIVTWQWQGERGTTERRLAYILCNPPVEEEQAQPAQKGKEAAPEPAKTAGTAQQQTSAKPPAKPTTAPSGVTK